MIFFDISFYILVIIAILVFIMNDYFVLDFLIILTLFGGFYYPGIFINNLIVNNFITTTFLPGFNLGFIFLLIWFISICDDSDFLLFPYLIIYCYFLHNNGYNLTKLLDYDWYYIIGCIMLYIVIGAIWSTIKFKIVILKNKEALRTQYSVKDKIKTNQVLHILELYKYRLHFWTVYWIFNVPYTFTSDIFRIMLNYIFSKLGRVYTRIIENTINN